jgi:hypothetical protein
VEILNIVSINIIFNMSDYQDWDDWYASGNKMHTPIIATVFGGEEDIFGPIGGSSTFVKRKQKRNALVRLPG